MTTGSLALAVSGFPRQRCRGLIEASWTALDGYVAAADFRGSAAAASLKRCQHGSIGVWRGDFRGSAAAASLKQPPVALVIAGAAAISAAALPRPH